MDPWEQQFGLVDDCLRACIFCDYISRKNPPNESAWRSIADICYADSIISWNQIFGQRSQETHWSKFVSKITIPAGDKLKPFNRIMIIEYLNISESEWEDYHKLMVDARNTRIAHLDVGISITLLPNITKALKTSYLYREWLTESLHLGNRLGFEIKISKQRAQDAVDTFTQQIRKAYHGGF